MTARPKPEGYQTAIPYLFVPGVDRLVAYLTEVFDAEQVLRLARPDGSIMHVELQMGDCKVMLGEPNEEHGPPMPGMIFLYVDDSDARYARAIAAGGSSVMEPTTMTFSGERYGGVKDPSGNVWWIAHRVEEVSTAEQQRRIDEMFG